MKVDAFWIWFVCAVLALGVQDFLTITKNSFDVSFHMMAQDSGNEAFGHMNLTVEGDPPTFTEVGKFIEDYFKKTTGEDVSIVVLTVSKIGKEGYWKYFGKPNNG